MARRSAYLFEITVAALLGLVACNGSVDQPDADPDNGSGGNVSPDPDGVDGGAPPSSACDQREPQPMPGGLRRLDNTEFDRSVADIRRTCLSIGASL